MNLQQFKDTLHLLYEGLDGGAIGYSKDVKESNPEVIKANPSPIIDLPSGAGTRVVCMCQRGDSRSVALAWLLKGKEYGMHAVAIGYETSPMNLRKILFIWAEKIIVCEQYMLKYVPENFRDKTSVFDVGPDNYFRGFDNSLIEKYRDYLRDIWQVESHNAVS